MSLYQDGSRCPFLSWENSPNSITPSPRFLTNPAFSASVEVLEIFSAFHLVKLNLTLKEWYILVMFVLWKLWLNRNAIIFRNQGKNFLALLTQIQICFATWANNLLAGHTSAASSISQAIQ